MKDSKKTAVPKLRFPEFLNSPEWKHEPLSTFISALDAGVSVNAGDRPARPAELGVLKTSCVTNGVFEPSENKVVLEPEEQERVTECVRGGTIIISRMNTPALVGANAYVENDITNVFLPDRLWAAKPVCDANMRFIAHILGSNHGRSALSALAAGSSGSMKNIAKSAVLELPIFAPEPDEQKKIADCLTSLDELIAAQGRKVEALTRYKRGLMQQLFPREGETIPGLRFPEFCDKDSWRLRKIGEQLKEVPRSINMEDAIEYSLVTVKRRYGGVVPRERLKGRAIKVKTQFVVRNGDFLISKRQIVHNACGIVPLELDGSIVSNEYSVLGPKRGCDIEFFNFFVQQPAVSASFLNSSVGIVIEKMLFKLKDWLKHEFLFPSFDEQKKIAAFLVSLAHKLTAESEKLESLKSHKKGLMQKLYPSLESKV